MMNKDELLDIANRMAQVALSVLTTLDEVHGERKDGVDITPVAITAATGLAGLRLSMAYSRNNPKPLTPNSQDYLTAVALLAAHKMGGLEYITTVPEEKGVMVLFTPS